MGFATQDPVVLKETVDIVRTYLRDSEGLNTLLCGKVESQDYDIELGVKMALSFFNSMTPYTSYTLKNFPSNAFGFLINDSVIEVLISAGILHSRNNLQYSSGGVTVNDHSQGGAYQGMAQVLSQLRQTRASEKQYKLQSNIESCYGGSGSEFFDSSRGYYIID